MSKRLQVTAIWETDVPDRDGLLPDRVLTNLADEVMGDLHAGFNNGDLMGDAANPNLRVDVQMMPHTLTNMTRSDYRNATPHIAYIFPETHPFAGIERAFRSGKTDEEIEADVRAEVVNLFMLSRGHD